MRPPECLGPRLQWSVLGPDVHTRQSKPGQRKLSSGAVILDLYVKGNLGLIKPKQELCPYSQHIIMVTQLVKYS
ncbi:hypothetical protein XENOCAPTIV_012361 [Xenoophorus captivus]|uniref:Uncharacterized protein n=1 Tax=Xenoophorus captivus TaxID=1517983 RepID=A0ABV0RS10_9TELE